MSKFRYFILAVNYSELSPTPLSLNLSMRYVKVRKLVSSIAGSKPVKWLSSLLLHGSRAMRLRSIRLLYVLARIGEFILVIIRSLSVSQKKMKRHQSPSSFVRNVL